MAFDPELLIKTGDVREVIRDELAGKITAPELIHILFELKKYAFPAADKTDKADMSDTATKTLDLRDMEQALPILERIHKRHQVDDNSWQCQECRASTRIGICIYMSLKSLIEGIKKGLEV